MLHTSHRISHLALTASHASLHPSKLRPLRHLKRSHRLPYILSHHSMQFSLLHLQFFSHFLVSLTNLVRSHISSALTDFHIYSRTPLIAALTLTLTVFHTLPYILHNFVRPRTDSHIMFSHASHRTSHSLTPHTLSSSLISPISHQITLSHRSHSLIHHTLTFHTLLHISSHTLTLSHLHKTHSAHPSRRRPLPAARRSQLG